MHLHLLRGLALVIALLIPVEVLAQPAIFIVRHAERADESTDSALSAAGRRRATRLAQLLKDSGVTVILTTKFKRTRDTAAPLATQQKIKLEVLDQPSEFAARLKALSMNDVALVVGHSNTVPEILDLLGYHDAPEIASNEFDNLYIVVTVPSQPPRVVRLRY